MRKKKDPHIMALAELVHFLQKHRNRTVRLGFFGQGVSAEVVKKKKRRKCDGGRCGFDMVCAPCSNRVRL